jgi:16S rRNA processing protein RimM
MESSEFTYPVDVYLLLGKVVKAQGLRGEVKIQTFSQQPENFAHYPGLVLVDTKGKRAPELTVSRYRIQGNSVIVQFDTVIDRNHAEQLVGMGVLVDRSVLPALPEDEFYWHQIEGLQVSTTSGQYLGTVAAIFSNGAQDVMVIRHGRDEYLVPLTKSIVRLQTNTELIIEPPPGLLEINSGEGEERDVFPG